MKALQKLKSRAGESLGEVMIAVLVAAIGITLLATMISAGSKVTADNGRRDDKYYGGNNLLEMGIADSGWDVTSGSGTVTVTVKDSNGVMENSMSATYYMHEAAGRKIVAYRKSS